MLGPSVRRLEHRGHRVAYAVHGNGPPLLCDLGRLHHLDVFWRHPGYRRLVERLAQEFSVIRLDRPGCGMSDRSSADFTVPAEVELFDHLLDHLGLEQVAVFASGTSSQVMLAVAALRPERISRLVLLGARASPHPETDAQYPPLRALLETEPRLAIRIVAQTTAAGGAETTVDWLADAYGRAVSGEVMRQLLDESVWLDVRELLERVCCPTLVLHRREDRLADLSASREVAAGIPGAILLPLDGASGLPWEPDLDALLKPLAGFLKPDLHTRLPGPLMLTPREQEVARMVAQGLTNAQIAEGLGIGRRTAESHIQHVRNRLGLSSRAELAAWSAVSLGEAAG